MNKVKVHTMLVDRETYGQLLYADAVTLKSALDGRRDYS